MKFERELCAFMKEDWNAPTIFRKTGKERTRIGAKGKCRQKTAINNPNTIQNRSKR